MSLLAIIVCAFTLALFQSIFSFVYVGSICTLFPCLHDMKAHANAKTFMCFTGMNTYIKFLVISILIMEVALCDDDVFVYVFGVKTPTTLTVVKAASVCMWLWIYSLWILYVKTILAFFAQDNKVTKEHSKYFLDFVMCTAFIYPVLTLILYLSGFLHYF